MIPRYHPERKTNNLSEFQLAFIDKIKAAGIETNWMSCFDLFGDRQGDHRRVLVHLQFDLVGTSMKLLSKKVKGVRYYMLVDRKERA